MILAFINELDSVLRKEREEKNYFTLHGLIMRNDDIVSGREDSNTETNKTTDNPSNEAGNSPAAVNRLSENSFEAKYLQFKDRIEKDRLAWEILANRK